MFTFQLMSGKVYTVEPFNGYRFLNLRQEVYNTLEDVLFEEGGEWISIDRIVIFNRNYEEVGSSDTQIDDYDEPEAGDHFYIVVRDA